MKILVVTSVFPNSVQPTLGVFVRERMSRVAQHCELKVVAPVPWFPFARLLKPGYRPVVPYREVQNGIEVFHPKFFSVPGVLKCLDGLFFCLSTFMTVRRLRKRYPFDVIDAHFLYPDGVGASLIGKLLAVPVFITVRESSLERFFRSWLLRFQIKRALQMASRIICVCTRLKTEVSTFGISPERISVIQNGVDIGKFMPADRVESRRILELPVDAKIVISVGWLIERKGFHRVIKVLPEIIKDYPELLFVIVGGESPYENFRPVLEQLVRSLRLEKNVIFAGSQPHDQLYRWLSAADLFCLATSGEGWANVFLEAMACGIPVITSRVGGNEEAVPDGKCGLLFRLEDESEMAKKLREGILRHWDRDKITAYAAANTWEHRTGLILKELEGVLKETDESRLPLSNNGG
jgi:teichuronic acid biosynthesis glycosyltransferase TuaC